MNKQVELNEYGFYSLVNKPSQQELEEYYATKYYQNSSGEYQNNYSEAEIAYLNNKIEQKYQKAIQLDLLNPTVKYSLLDIGCGEGFALNHFMKKGWDVIGLDYSDYGCNSMNPQCSQYLIQGEIYANIDILIKKGMKYDVIWIDNVLEHVLDPLFLLHRLNQLSSETGVLVIEVPNDFSVVQNYLLENDYLKDDFWVVVPDHISYFNYDGLVKICKDADWKYGSIMGDFPIDWFLFNEHSNYNRNRKTGKAAHASRVAIENMLHHVSIEKTNDLYEKMAELGVGRQLIGIFKSNKS